MCNSNATNLQLLLYCHANVFFHPSIIMIFIGILLQLQKNINGYN